MVSTVPAPTGLSGVMVPPSIPKTGLGVPLREALFPDRSMSNMCLERCLTPTFAQVMPMSGHTPRSRPRRLRWVALEGFEALHVVCVQILTNGVRRTPGYTVCPVHHDHL